MAAPRVVPPAAADAAARRTTLNTLLQHVEKTLWPRRDNAPG